MAHPVYCPTIPPPWPPFLKMFCLHPLVFFSYKVKLTVPVSPSLSNLSKIGPASEVLSRGCLAYSFPSMFQRVVGCPPTPSHLLSVYRHITVMQRQKISMTCFCQFNLQTEPLTVICAPSSFWCMKQTGSLQVCKHALCFICFEPLPGCGFWQLLSHTEQQMIHSCGFNAIP